MAKITIEKRYGTVSNSLLNNPEVTFKAKGIFAYIQSKPDDWDFSAERISGQTKEGLGAVKSGLRELERSGHLIRRRVNNNKGFFEVEYILIAEPSLEPMVKNPLVDKPTVDNYTNNSKKVNSKKEISNNLPAEENKDNIYLLTSDTTMYESKKTNIELNCTLPISDITIPVSEKKPKKEAKDPSIMLENRRFSKDFTDAWNAAGKEKLGQIGYVAINKLFAKHGYDKGMFFCHYLCQMHGSNEKSIAKIENQDKAFLFYQDPQEEQPKYIGNQKFDSSKRFKNEQEEPSLGSFYNEDSFYAALEYFYSNQFEGTELVKKVRERVKEINCKYNKY